MSTYTVAWKYSDGSGGQRQIQGYEYAFSYMLVVAEHSPHARVWFDQEVIQRGFTGEEDRR